MPPPAMQETHRRSGTRRACAGCGNIKCRDCYPELPKDVEAETAVISSILLEPSRLPVARGIVTEEDFSVPPLGRVLAAMKRLQARGDGIDLLTVSDEMVRSGDLPPIDAVDDSSRAIGVEAHKELAAVLDGAWKARNLEYYATRVARAAVKRRTVLAARDVQRVAMNGADLEEVCEAIRSLAQLSTLRGGAAPVDLFGQEVRPELPEFSVDGLVGRGGVHLVWAPPGSLKTWAMLNLAHQLLLTPRPLCLWGVPQLRINRTYRRLLWIGTEETAGVLRSKADRVRRGLERNRGSIAWGELHYVWASEPRRRITVLDLPDLLAAHGRFDGVVLDSLTGLRPRELDGKPVRWDLDNDASNTLCLMLRGLAASADVDLFLAHHSGKDQKAYRGGVEWWASADVMAGLTREEDRVRVLIEKSRDGRIVPAFNLVPAWSEEGFVLTYDGPAAKASRLPPSAERAQAVLRERGGATSVEVQAAIGKSRSAVKGAFKLLVELGRIRGTGVERGQSKVFEAVPALVAPADAGLSEQEVQGVRGV